MSDSEYAVSHLREQPQFTDLVAQRIWAAWWEDDGTPLSHIRARVAETLTSDGLPLTLAAHRNGVFLGTASVIECDLEERAGYAPWVAAVWVEPSFRSIGVGSALVDAAARAAFELGRSPVYLCATSENAGYYPRLGWSVTEADVGGLTVFSRSQPTT